VLAKLRNDHLAEAFLITEIGNTDVGAWFALADMLADALADELGEQDGAVEHITHLIDESLP
jgi:hypothetical protein